MSAQIREEGRCGLAAELLQSRGALQLRAMGSSMLPTLWPGDLVIVQSSNFEQVQVGDIVLYVRRSRFCLHRVLRKSNPGSEPFLITRGDSMPKEDFPVQPREVLGVVTAVCRRSVTVPARKLSTSGLILGRMLCYSNLCSRVALRLHAHRQREDSGVEFLAGNPAL